MNKDNVKVSIRAVTERKNFNMSWWFPNLPKKIPEKITCNTAACIGGCTALTPEWKEQGGSLTMCASPLLKGMHGIKAMAKFWDNSDKKAAYICASTGFYRVVFLKDITREMALAALNHLLETGSTKGFTP